LKIALISPPSHNYTLPAPGIAYIKGVLNKENIESKCFDLNHEFFKKFGPEAIEWCEYGIKQDEAYVQFIFDYCEKLVGYDWIGISLFSFNSQIATKVLLQAIKDWGITSKIVLGGNGLVNSSGSIEIFGLDFNDNFGEKMIAEGLADHYIMGEGDRALPALLRGKSYQYAQMNDLSDLPYPDYSDFNLDSYGKNMVTITGSRGCVRNCTFCDVNLIWNKYKFRPGEEVAAEMIHQYETHGVDLFYFSDSLVNGSLKEFRKFCRIMAEKNLPIRWMGQFIFRSGMTDEDWDYVKASGCQTLWIGIESGSEKTRWHMQKKFDNRALYASIKACGERKINMLYLLIAGYPTETEEDFEETIKMLYKSEPYHEYIEIRCNIAMLMKGTQMLANTDWHGEHIEAWKVNLEDGELDLKERIRRWARILTVAKELNMKRDNRLEQIKRENIRKLSLIDNTDELIEIVKSI
jgi:anaerobic magnesium-protoporphyrin IX monomethyl ester cyclase